MNFIPYRADDMVYTDYSNTQTGPLQPETEGPAGKGAFIMQERSHMLRFINDFARDNQWEGDQISAYRLLERVMREKLPADVVSFAAATAWLRATHGRTFKMRA